MQLACQFGYRLNGIRSGAGGICLMPGDSVLTLDAGVISRKKELEISLPVIESVVVDMVDLVVGVGSHDLSVHEDRYAAAAVSGSAYCVGSGLAFSQGPAESGKVFIVFWIDKCETLSAERDSCVWL